MGSIFDTNKLSKRDTRLDILRVIAVFSVLSVHFLLNNGFYYQNIEGKEMFFLVYLRSVFCICVPLFLVITGYLMCMKTLSKQYYRGIVKTLVIFILCSIACMLYKQFYSDIAIYTPLTFIFGIFDYTGATYSWYIEMYFGLFLLIPFLNLIYQGLKSEKQKQALVVTMFCLTILPSIFNIYNFTDTSWWSKPSTSTEYAKFIPAWWTSLYPVTYYFVGCYLREFGLKLRARTCAFLFALLSIVFAAFNFYRSFGTTFDQGIYVYWHGFQPFILTILMFGLVLKFKANKLPTSVRFSLWKLSDLALTIYLISYISDSLIYKYFNEHVLDVLDKGPYYFIVVPMVFILSTALAILIHGIYHLLTFLFSKFKILLQIIKDLPKNTKVIYLFSLLFGLVFLFAFWKCSYGFGGNDEAFYLTIPHRLSMGDRLFADEWHLSQLSGFLLIPFVKLFTLITGSTVGIIYFMRICYLIFHSLICGFTFTRLKKYGYSAVFATIIYYIYTPYDIMALSYNTMALDLILLAGILVSTYKDNMLPRIFAGIALAAAVLCCPYLAVAYIIYALFVALNFIFNGKQTSVRFLDNEVFKLKTFIYVTFGVIILAVIFLGYLLATVGINEVFKNLPYMLEDPEHPGLTIGEKLRLYFKTMFESHEYFAQLLYSYIGMLVLLVIDRNRKNHRCFYLIFSSFISIFSLLLFLPSSTYSHYNAIMFVLIFPGLTSYLLLKNKNVNLFASVFMLSIIYSFSVCFSSNQYFYVESMASSVANIVSVIFIFQLIKEIKEKPDKIAYKMATIKLAIASVSLTLLMLAYTEIRVKYNHCFWEAYSATDLTYQIDDGPAKGIYTTPENGEAYTNIYYDLTNLYSNKKPDNILVLSERTWTYLALEDFNYGTFSAWLSGETMASLNRLETFYNLNPEKIPKYIYLPKEAKYEDMQGIVNRATDAGYTFDKTDYSYQLYK